MIKHHILAATALACAVLLGSAVCSEADYYIGVDATELDAFSESSVHFGQYNGPTSTQVDTGGVKEWGYPGGFASANLATGELKLIARSDSSATGYSEGIAQGAMVDTLQFHLPVGLLQSTIGFDFRVDGTIAMLAGAEVRGAGVTFTFGDTRLDTEISGCCALGTAAFPLPLDFNGSLLVVDGQSVTFHVDMTAASLSLTGEGVGLVDFGDTASFSLSLPSGVTFTSDSGVFLTQQAAVPEPGTLTLLGSSFAGLGGIVWRRNRRA